MKLKFKHQRFQEELAKAVCDVLPGNHALSQVYDFQATYPLITDSLIINANQQLNSDSLF